MKSGFDLIVTISSSASRGCSGNDAVLDLHALREQLKKLSERIFIFEKKRRCSCALVAGSAFLEGVKIRKTRGIMITEGGTTCRVLRRLPTCLIF